VKVFYRDERCSVRQSGISIKEISRRPVMKSVKLLMLVGATTIFFVACSESAPTSEQKSETTLITNSAPSSNIDELASVQQIYKENCAECHKDNGTGGPINLNGRDVRVPDLTSAKVKRLPDEAYLRYIRNGDEEEGMPAFKDKLSGDEMVALVKFIRREIQSAGIE
jgi:cytochrome c5